MVSASILYFWDIVKNEEIIRGTRTWIIFALMCITKLAVFVRQSAEILTLINLLFYAQQYTRQYWYAFHFQFRSIFNRNFHLANSHVGAKLFNSGTF